MFAPEIPLTLYSFAVAAAAVFLVGVLARWVWKTWSGRDEIEEKRGRVD